MCWEEPLVPEDETGAWFYPKCVLGIHLHIVIGAEKRGFSSQ